MMRELDERPAACAYCGALSEHLSTAGAMDGAGWTAWSVSKTCALANLAGRQRSGLAYASGFAGLFSLFRYSFATFLFTNLGLKGLVGMTLFMLWSMSAPAAVVLAYAAGVSLDRLPEKAGRLPALMGLLTGLYGTYRLAVFLTVYIQVIGR